MHKGVILLTTAENKEEAINNTNDFLQPYQDLVFDWYVVGGRWSGTLNPKTKEFYQKVKERKIFNDDRFISVYEVKKKKQTLQKIWEEIGAQGTNPYNRDTYIEEGYTDDCMEALQCQKILKEWEEEKESTKFTFDTNLFDIDMDTNRLPDNLDGYYAVMIDMHF